MASQSQSGDGDATCFDDQDHDDSWIAPADRAVLQRMPDMPRTLPRDTSPIRFIGEGSANVVFQINVPHDGFFKGKLLRVAKASTYNYLLQQDFYHTSIQPLLGDHAVLQQLVILRGTPIIQLINAVLRRVDPSRKAKFRGSFVAQSNWGFLVEDMRPDAGERIVEFKPKWLSQSPSAPQGAIRCRQCALGLLNLVHDKSQSRPEDVPCPLALANPDAPVQVRSPLRIAPNLGGQNIEPALALIADHQAIRLLRAEQERLDKTGPLGASQSDPRFPLAMTLRDCTCFALISSEGSVVKVRLGDFDWKDPKVKFDHWVGTETSLVQGGFYTADWIVCVGGDRACAWYILPTLCALEWIRPTDDKVANGPEIIVLKDRGRCVQNWESKLSTARMYVHETDVEAAQRALRGFEKDASVRNPFRLDPPDYLDSNKQA